MEGIAYFLTPVGELEIRSRGDAITGVSFLKGQKEPEKETPQTRQCRQELEEYFAGSRKFFTVPLEADGTEFQKQVWSALLDIPLGRTISYAELATRLGNLKAIRAVGLANGQNPIAIIIPCHRVIGKDGSLVGYGGGLDNKLWLLKHEGALADQLDLF
ncbi:MAG TPA: methylated-DNA--[protein]-cysteine S-methyltransferase [Cyclobacteriaceae bacterium]|nr:methylated-DNA--[protein]-cysteine S-methyltransferase [Cyclobacteriaceae bacterium]